MYMHACGVRVFVCEGACARSCMWVMHVFPFVCTYVYVGASLCVSVYTFMHVDVCVFEYVCVPRLGLAHIHTHSYMHNMHAWFMYICNIRWWRKLLDQTLLQYSMHDPIVNLKICQTYSDEKNNCKF